jgi:hypothetical protein
MRWSITWCQGVGLEVYPIELAEVTLPIGKQVESRQIAVLPLLTGKNKSHSTLMLE